MLKISFLEQNDELVKLAEKIAHELNGYVVPDYEKEYREMVNRELTALDYYRIAKGILNKELEYEHTSKKFLLSVNNPFLVYQKSLKNTGQTHPKFEEVLNRCNYDYLLTENPLKEPLKQLQIKNIKELNYSKLQNFIKEKIEQ